MMMRLSELATVLNGHLRGEDAAFECVGTDSRAVQAGQLFVALRGERFDAHRFVSEALEAGAVGAVIDQAGAEHISAGPVVVVEDTKQALGRLAAHWRARFTLPVIGVTGSNGKTSVKEMCAAILRAQAVMEGAAETTVLATAGNLNNEIGLPLTLLGLRPHHRAAVVEMGMNHPGEIGYLADIARPTVAIVTNAQRAHLEGMGSLEEIAQEKGSIYVADDSTIAIINEDDAQAEHWHRQVVGRRMLTFGLERGADVRGCAQLHGLEARFTLECFAGHAEITLQMPGRHNVSNALAAAAACLAAGTPFKAVVAGLEACQGERGRLQKVTGPKGSLLIDDTYNANPDSVRAAIDVLAAQTGRQILVLGDMGEVGETRAQVHDEIGGYAKSRGVDVLLTLGDMSELAARNFGEGGRHFESLEALLAALAPQLSEHTTVLVKGSRFMRMERVIDALVGMRDEAASGAKGDWDAT